MHFDLGEQEIPGGHADFWACPRAGNRDTSAGKYSPILRRARGFVSAGGDVLHAGSISSVVSSPSLAHDLIDRRLDETGSDPFPVAIALPVVRHELLVALDRRVDRPRRMVTSSPLRVVVGLTRPRAVGADEHLQLH